MDQDSVLEYLRNKAKRPLKPKDLARALRIATADYSDFKKLLREMEASGAIYRVRRGRYASPERINLVVGRLQITRGGHGFVVPDDRGEDVFVRSSQLGNAFAGDRVVARIEHQRRGQNPEGTIVRVLERARNQFVGVFRRSGRFGFLVPKDRTIHRDIFLPPGDIKATDGELVVVEIVDWGSQSHDPVGQITRVLGAPGEPGVDILGIVYGHQLPAEFPEPVLREAESLAKRSGVEAAAVEGRKDYRRSLIFTIDPADARDHDDALSIEKVKADRWRVGIHIADVSHFVREGTALNTEAFERGTSVYLVDRVIPMLPEVLSGDLCSLKPDEDRLALTVNLELDSKAKVYSAVVEESVICSRHRLSYEDAQEIIDGGRKAPATLRDALRGLRDLALELFKKRQGRGGLDFDLPEARIVLNAAGEPTHIQEMLRLESHRLIEEFMILANEAVAKMASRRDWPFMYRVHEAPDPSRLERLREFILGLGLQLRKDAHRTPRALQRLLQTVEGRPEEAVVSTLVLRSLKQARYQRENKGHFGLGSKAYAHFTSPIRRYPDLIVHRIIRAKLLGGRPLSGAQPEKMEKIADHASFQERRAMDAERDSVELKKMEYMERHVGDTFAGTIGGVTSYGLFVLLDDVLVEGLIHVSSLEDDYYHYEEEAYALVGESGRRRYRLGDRLEVRVLGVDRAARELDLAPA